MEFDEPHEWLLYTNYEQQKANSFSEKGTDTEDKEQEKLPLSYRAWASVQGIGSLLWLAWAVYEVFRLFTDGFSKNRAMILVMIGAVLLVALGRKIWYREWWIAPGTLLFRTCRLWRSHTQVGGFTARNSALVLGGECSAVIHNERHWAVSHGEEMAWVILAGWLSQAPPPTREEILTFLGPDADWDDKLDNRRRDVTVAGAGPAVCALTRPTP